MIKFLLVVIGVLTLACVISVGIVGYQRKRRRAAEQRAQDYQAALDEAQSIAERLQVALSKQAEIEEAANVEKQALSNTADSDLINRANCLF